MAHTSETLRAEYDEWAAGFTAIGRNAPDYEAWLELEVSLQRGQNEYQSKQIGECTDLEAENAALKAERDELRAFYDFMVDCDAQNELLDELRNTDQLDIWAELYAILETLRETFPRSGTETTN